MNHLQPDQSLLRLPGSSGGCPPALLCVSTVGRDFNKDPAHYAQQARDEIEAVYWRYNRIGAESGTKTNPMSCEQPTSERPKSRTPVSWPSSLHGNDPYISLYQSEHEFDLDSAMLSSKYRYVEEVNDEDQWDM